MSIVISPGSIPFIGTRCLPLKRKADTMINMGCGSAADTEQAEREARPIRESIQKALGSPDGRIEFTQLIRLYHWSTLSEPANRPKRVTADELLEPARTRFKANNPQARLGLVPI